MNKCMWYEGMSVHACMIRKDILLITVNVCTYVHSCGSAENHVSCCVKDIIY